MSSCAVAGIIGRVRRPEICEGALPGFLVGPIGPSYFGFSEDNEECPPFSWPNAYSADLGLFGVKAAHIRVSQSVAR